MQIAADFLIGFEKSFLHLKALQTTQHDELEPNLRKIPRRNGIWDLEAIDY